MSLSEAWEGKISGVLGQTDLNLHFWCGWYDCKDHWFLNQTVLVKRSAISAGEGKINECDGTVVRPSGEYSVLIFFFVITLSFPSNAEHWRRLIPMQILGTQSASCFLLFKVINCILLVTHVYSVLIKQLEWKPSVLLRSSWEPASRETLAYSKNCINPESAGCLAVYESG